MAFTADEVYALLNKKIKSGGGTGGGGTTSWNDLTDKPFYVSYVHIVEENTVEFTQMEEMGGMFVGFIEPFENIDGDEYIVNYNGTDYACVSIDGAIGILDGDNATPFMILASEGAIISLNGDASATISIKKKQVTAIENQYIPEPYFIDLVELGLPAIGRKYNVSVETNKLYEWLPHFNSGIVRVKLNLQGPVYKLLNTNANEIVTVNINMMINHIEYNNESGTIEYVVLTGIYGRQILEIEIYSYNVNAISKAIALDSAVNV